MMRDELRNQTAPALLAQRARDEPDGVAYRAKHLGLYREQTWSDYACDVARVPTDCARLAWRPASAWRSWATCARRGCWPTRGRRRSGHRVRGIPHRVDGRVGLPDGRRRCIGVRRRGPGVRRQDPRGDRSVAGATLDRCGGRHRDDRLRPSQAEDVRRAAVARRRARRRGTLGAGA